MKNNETWLRLSHKRIEDVKPGDLVTYHDMLALVIRAPFVENFIGALVEILVDGRAIQAPLGMLKIRECTK